MHRDIFCIRCVTDSGNIFLDFTEIYTFSSGNLNFLIHLTKIYLGVKNNILKPDITLFLKMLPLFFFSAD